MRDWYKKKTNSIEDKIKIRKSRIVSSARRRAKKFGVPCDIDSSSFEIPEFCPALGLRISLSNRCVGLDSPVLDRMIPSKGYVEGNINIISQKANLIKSNGTIEEIESVLNWMKEHY